jgi:DnaJ family protein A protein 5
LEQEAQALPSWATARPADEQEEESEEDIEEEHYECVACNKTFKSERQYEAHEKSKKHQKAIQSLKRKMRKDNAHLHLDEDALSSGVVTPADEDLAADDAGSDANGSGDAIDDLAGRTDELRVDDDTDGEDEGTVASGPRTNHNDQDDEASDDDDKDDEDDEYTSRSDIEARLNGLASTHASTAHTEDPTTEQTMTEDMPAESEDSSAQLPKLGKAAQKRAKRAAKQAEVADTDSSHRCMGCDATFPSKTRLHQHLQDHPKHAALKSVPVKGKKKGKR